MNERNIRIEGKLVYLEEISPKYFEKVIEWRNNPENNKFLNQPFKLTIELEKQWYEEKYLNDKTQGLFIVIDKEKKAPFATIGYTDYDENKKICIIGRLLVGELQYRGSDKWREGTYVFNEYIYNILNVNVAYAHIVCENISSIKWHKKWYYKENKFEVQFPDELFVNGMKQKEFYRTKEEYNSLKLKSFCDRGI